MPPAALATRLLVGLNGRDPDVRLIRYASMVARLNQWPGGEASEQPQSPAGPPLQSDPEVRFVYLFPHAQAGPGLADDLPSRAVFRAQINSHFTIRSSSLAPFSAWTDGQSERVAIGYDVLRGKALRRLPGLAGDFDSDLLLLGQSTWPSSACARIAMEAPCSVWLVPAGSAPVLRRLLVPCDFSDRSAAALQVAINIARRSQHAKCFVLHAYWIDSRFADARLQREELRRLRQKYDRFAARIDKHGVTVEPLFVEGPRVDHQIGQAARRRRVDLVVASSRGRTRIARWLLPSVADLAIRRCQTSFLLLRTADQPVGGVRGLRECLSRPADWQFS
jgi:nucleotide-binding universal stress UspA family protein